jgi:hypothetical protein
VKSPEVTVDKRSIKAAIFGGSDVNDAYARRVGGCTGLRRREERVQGKETAGVVSLGFRLEQTKLQRSDLKAIIQCGRYHRSGNRDHRLRSTPSYL